ncbi:MAG: 2-hydroxychromene-2-carboxylate isomerase/DsbA-like thioredoxin domain [uncultured Gemmatimonadaceae bacterium]|uniref:2-hydroxychromene-2-carboxylate isomerase/DsbA-like thioredoxin domain n=1 Tax=uncultured Gemmatimonadaceae bacterium TaxID=246130 RepID=A0A6J4KB20_9BACT|nr:MAG: 2-hydroxychromene-2-carboxylate isomerase/DsbA-like thioredoxin domain [uncultured Gemmatimonadaceae bacterium]
MKVEIWSDIACPWCYIGKRRFERALEGFEDRSGVEVVWRSFELDPTAPRQHDAPQAELLARKYRMPLAQAEAMNARMTGEAAKEGLTFRMDRVRVGNTFDAHRLIHLAAAAGRREAMVERLFAAYLGEGEALGDVEVLVRLAVDAGLDARTAREALASGAFADAVRADEARARAFGITGVPFFAIDERYGVSGAQPPEAILGALRQAWSESGRALVAAAAPADGCADGSCAI